MDQANKLRDMVNEKNLRAQVEAAAPVTSRVIAVTSGKGGVGKTNFTINLAIQLRKQNKRVVIIDADFGLANIEVLFGVIPKYNFGDILSGKRNIEEALSTGPMDIKFLSGGSGLASLANMTDSQLSRVFESFTYIDTISDVILIDTGAGISRTVINFINASKETIIITTPEPTSITDAYAIIKVTKEAKVDLPEFKIVVNRVDDYREGNEIFEKLNMVSDRFLGIKLQSLGTIPYDGNLIKAVKKQQPVSLCYPNTEITRSIENISLRLLNMDSKNENSEGIRSFMKRLVTAFRR